MKRIPLTKAKFAIVDDEDFEWLSKSKWRCSSCGYAVGVSKGSHRTRRPRTMHREIIKCPESLTVDHINRNKLDNRKENLRICSFSQNNMNRPIRADNKAGYKGVHKDKTCKNRYVAQIRINREKVYLGGFNCPIEAAKAYDKAAKESQGEFACTNF